MTNKKALSESDICDRYVTPAITKAGWATNQWRREYGFTDGKIIVRGKLVARGKRKRTDYLIFHTPNLPIALVEAKDNNHTVGSGMQQALAYAETLDVPFVFSSNGDGFLFHDRTGTFDPIERTLTLDEFRVDVDGVTVAESHQPRLLFETGLPVRYYLPKTDVRMRLLQASGTHTECPYKGTASYYDVAVNGTTYSDFVWWYPTTTLEAAKIAGYACFYNEKVDLYVDGKLQERPRTPFS